MKKLFLLLALALPLAARGAMINPALIGAGHATNLTASIFVDGRIGSDRNSGSQVSPLRTLRQAKTNAIAGKTIFVSAGSYTNNNLAKNGVNWDFAPGAKVYYTNAPGADSHGFFDDRDGVLTNTITGAGEFYYNGGTNVANNGVLVLTNPASRVHFQAGVMAVGGFGIASLRAPVNVFNGTAFVDVDELVDLTFGQRFTIDPEEEIFLDSNVTGVYWELGELHVNFRWLHTFSAYGLYGHNTDTSTSAEHNLWVSGQLLDDYSYMAANTNNPNWRTWIDVNEIKGGISYFNGGRHYLTAQKISATTNGLGTCIGLLASDTLTNVTVWANVQKLSQEVANIPLVTLATNCTLFLDVLHFEDRSSGASALVTQSGGYLELRGGVARLKSKGISFTGGSADIKGLTIDTRLVNAADSFPVTVSAAGLSLENCKLLGPALCTNAIYATSGKTVQSLNTWANLTNNSNITIQGSFSNNASLF